MKLRCRARRGSVAGAAFRHSYGPYVEIATIGTGIGSSIGSSTGIGIGVVTPDEPPSSLLLDSAVTMSTATATFRGCVAKGKRVKGPLCSPSAVCLPPVGDPFMISLLEGLLKGRHLLPHALANIAQTTPDQLRLLTASGAALLGPIDERRGIRDSGRAAGLARFMWNNFFGGRLVFENLTVGCQPAVALLTLLRGVEWRGNGQIGSGYTDALLEESLRSMEAVLFVLSATPNLASGVYHTRICGVELFQR